MGHTKDEVNIALDKVRQIVYDGGNERDIAYFDFHKLRYYRMALTLTSVPEKGRVTLNIGSHYLHSSLLLKFLDYEVHSMDVEVFWDIDFVKERAKKYELPKIAENNLETLKSQENINDKYDIVLFTEIMEHITYNPILFWEKIYKLTKSGGLIYISTPNSLSLTNIVRTFSRLVAFRGVGTPVNEIFRNVTYGHHWKEYSASEIKRYFSKMSDDFKVSIRKYNYINLKITGVMSGFAYILSFIGNKSVFFADDIEAIVRVNKTGSWKLEPPQY